MAHWKMLDATFPSQPRAFNFAWHCARVARARDPLYRTKVTKVHGTWRVSKTGEARK